MSSSKHARTVELVPLVSPADTTAPSAPSDGPAEHFLRVEVAYNVGGMNYFSGGTTRRGYYLRATPVARRTMTDSAGARVGFTESFMLFSGSGFLLEETKRFSATSLDRLTGAARLHPRYGELKDAVITKNKLAVKPDGPAFERRPAEYPA